MKTLYMVTNGDIGGPHLRCYVWADSEERALELARAQRRPREIRPEWHICALFQEGDAEFVTPFSDSGWPGES